MIAVDLQMIVSVGALLVAVWFVQWLLTYLMLNMSMWLSQLFANDLDQKNLRLPPLPSLAFYLLMISSGASRVAKKLIVGGDERTLETVALVMVSQFLVTAIAGGYFVQSSLGFKYPKSVAIAAMTSVATMLVMSAVYLVFRRALPFIP